MVYKYINSAIVVGDIFDQYNIKSEEFISRTPNWILRCLEDIHCYQVYVDKAFKGNTTNKMVYLPEEFKKIRNVWINGNQAHPYYGYEQAINSTTLCERDDTIRLCNVGENPPKEEACNPDTSTAYNPKNHCVYNPYGGFDLANWINPGNRNPGNGETNSNNECNSNSNSTNSSIPKYLIENGWMKTSEDGEVALLYAALPMEFDEANHLWFPLIPDNENVRAAIGWYVITRILYRGYIHPVLNLNSNSPFTNPGLAYREAKHEALFSCNQMNFPYIKSIVTELNLKFGQSGLFNDTVI